MGIREIRPGQLPDFSVFWEKSFFSEGGSLKNVGPFFRLDAFKSFFGDYAGAQLEKYFELLEHYGGNVPEAEQAAIERLEREFQTHAGFAISDVYAAKDKV